MPVAVLSSIHSYETGCQQPANLQSTATWNSLLIAAGSSPVTTMGYNERCHTVVSSDAKGMLEYWSVSTRKWPQKNLSFKYRVTVHHRLPANQFTTSPALLVAMALTG